MSSSNTTMNRLIGKLVNGRMRRAEGAKWRVQCTWLESNVDKSPADDREQTDAARNKRRTETLFWANAFKLKLFFFYHLYSAEPLILVVGLWASTHPHSADAYLCSERREILWFIFQWILCRAKNCRKIHRYGFGWPMWCAHIFACVRAPLFRRWRWYFFSFELCSSLWNVCYSVAPIARSAIGSLFHANGSNSDDDDDIEVWFSDERNSFRFSAKEKMFLFLSFLTSSIYSVAGWRAAMLHPPPLFITEQREVISTGVNCYALRLRHAMDDSIRLTKITIYFHWVLFKFKSDVRETSNSTDWNPSNVLDIHSGMKTIRVSFRLRLALFLEIVRCTRCTSTV